MEVKSGTQESTFTHTWLNTLPTQGRPLSESCSQGIMTAFCRNHGRDSSHRQDRQRKKKRPFLSVFTSPPTLHLLFNNPDFVWSMRPSTNQPYWLKEAGYKDPHFYQQPILQPICFCARSFPKMAEACFILNSNCEVQPLGLILQHLY